MPSRTALARIAPITTLVLALVAWLSLEAAPLSSQSPTTADGRLLEAIDLYTGVAGRVDDDRAHELLLKVSADGGDVLAQMWIARVHSRGRMGFAHDEHRARDVAARAIAGIRDLAATGDVEAIFLMGTAYDEGLGADVDRGVTKGLDQATYWYGRASASGHADPTEALERLHELPR